MGTGQETETRLVVGCMTGTSLDALDVALVQISGRGLDMRIALVRTLSQPLGSIGEGLRRLANQEAFSAGAIAALNRDFSALHAEAIREIVGEEIADLVAVHGQTVYHAPPLTWQLLEPAIIARRLCVPVVSNLRAADVAAGGQGAPITPLADYILFRDEKERRAVLNLGGFCNYTTLPPRRPRQEHFKALDGIEAGDICACNHVLDGLARHLFNLPFDEGGSQALQGQVENERFTEFVDVLEKQGRLGRSLGTDDDLAEGWMRLSRVGDGSAAVKTDPRASVLRTACAAVATVAVNHIGAVDRLILAGGGVLNKALLGEFQKRAKCPVNRSDDLGVPAPYREAIAMAVLGALCEERIPITLPQVTKVPGPAPVAGSWVYP